MDIMKLLEISIETHFKTMDGRIYFQRDGLPIGKSISKPLAGIYMHWFERNFVFNNDNSLKQYLKFGKGRWMTFSLSGQDQKMI